jgi:hypothetical protein
MREAVAPARITPPISFHGLRHTWASLAAMNRVPLLVVAQNLGHTDTRMVEKHYGHLAPSYVAEAIRAGAPRYSEQEKARVGAAQASTVTPQVRKAPGARTRQGAPGGSGAVSRENALWAPAAAARGLCSAPSFDAARSHAL